MNEITLTTFHYLAAGVAIVMLIWNTVEVGRNDAANIVNAVFGARVMPRKRAVLLAGIAVVFGAMASAPVMETARKGIFDPAALSSLDKALAVYIAVYLSNTVLLYSFSAFGMPVSTTACLVFGLLGGGFAMGGFEAVNWAKSSQVIAGIICSIVVSGIAGFLIQRAFRGAIRGQCEDHEVLKLHGPWIAGALLTGLVYFMLVKGMKHVGFVAQIKTYTIDALGAPAILFIVWGSLSVIVFLLIQWGGARVSKRLFSGLAVVGMLATGVAFGQNDLANCASPGLAAYMIIKNQQIASEVPVQWYLLLGCGVLLFLGMASQTAQRVTRAEVNTGSQGDRVRLYAPNWCQAVAGFLVPKEKSDKSLAPKPAIVYGHKLQHYDALRAAVITSVTGSVIAFASGMGLPVSTTYVAFAAVISTGWADRIFLRGDARLKMGRTVWVVFCWFFSAFLAAAAAGSVALLIIWGGTIGIAAGLCVNLSVRYVIKKKADAQEERLQKEADQRRLSAKKDGDDSSDPMDASDADASQM